MSDEYVKHKTKWIGIYFPIRRLFQSPFTVFSRFTLSGNSGLTSSLSCRLHREVNRVQVYLESTDRLNDSLIDLWPTDSQIAQ